ncbi:MAG: arylsulfotransferase family protein [Thermoanaerobaculia bacterium]|nr:arylsulfotransferase family protein [Thermoanaerobaculia bacterium]
MDSAQKQLGPWAIATSIGAIATSILLLISGCGVANAPDAAATDTAEVSEVVEAQSTQRLYSTSDENHELASLPYAERTVDPEWQNRGVVLHDPERAFEGLNFYSSRDLPAAFLLDMDGEPVHQWRRRGGAWQHVDLLPNGDVLALVKDTALVRVDLDSEIVWIYKAAVHHDLWRTSEGEIYVLARKTERRPKLHPRHPIQVDYILVLDDEGQLLREISVLDLILNSPYAFLLPSTSHRLWAKDGVAPEDIELDFIHTNHVEVLDGSLEDFFPHYRKGHLLLSFRHLNTIAIADPAAQTLVWAWGPTNVTRQHHPTVLENGNILLFDNGKKTSKVLELDPRTSKIVWSYGDDPDFFTPSRGGNVRLANGNTLITESDPGYVFEVTPDGETVWRFANPRIDKNNERAAIWRMVRFTEGELPFLQHLEPDA